jgi:hypothetical protein
MGKPGTPMQDRAVIREWQEAMQDHNVCLAGDIARANPDLFELGSDLVPREQGCDCMDCSVAGEATH